MRHLIRASSIVLGVCLLSAAGYAMSSRITYPQVRQVWLRQMPMLAAAQNGQPQQRHDRYSDDPHAYCWNPQSSGSQARQREQDPHGHQCACHLECQVGPNGDVVGDREDTSCALYCTRELCKCHVESPCEMPDGHR
jgi:hypothetical protein